MAAINKNRLAIISALSLLIGALWLLSYSAVDLELTDEDKSYTALFLNGVPALPANPSYADQLKFIESTQRAILDIAPHAELGPIAMNSQREPKDLYAAKTGYCYYRSRTIEKILRANGFKVRHVYIVSKVNGQSTLKMLMTSGTESHALTEVLTKKGWLLVGSNSVWTSVDVNNEPISIEELKYRSDNAMPLQLKTSTPQELYMNSFSYIYGLYSRHGKFYPPYNFIPDVNYTELAQNFGM